MRPLLCRTTPSAEMKTRIFKRVDENPIISPLDVPFQAAAMLNPGTTDTYTCLAVAKLRPAASRQDRHLSAISAFLGITVPGGMSSKSGMALSRMGKKTYQTAIASFQ